MKQKILAALKTEYAKSGLSDKAFDGVAAVLAKTVTKEDEIDGVVRSDETRGLVQAYQSDTDRVRTEKAQLQSEFDKYKTEHPGEKPDPNPEPPKPGPDDALLKRIEALEQANREKDERLARNEKIAAVRASMKEQGSDNDAILDLVLEKAEFKPDDRAADIAAGLKSSYDAAFKRFYGEGPVPRVHRNAGPEDYRKEDSDFVARLRAEGKLPQEQEK